MFLADSPGWTGHEPTLVASTTSARLPRAVSQLPMMVSDSPPELPGRRHRYESAVSMKLPPAAWYASITSNDSSWSEEEPNTLPPRQSGCTDSSVPGREIRMTQP